MLAGGEEIQLRHGLMTTSVARWLSSMGKIRTRGAVRRRSETGVPADRAKANGPFALLLGGEILIAVGEQNRALNHDEGVIERAVALIAAGTEPIERGHERSMIFGINGFF